MHPRHESVDYSPQNAAVPPASDARSSVLPDYYEILRVDPDAEEAAIKSAYRRLAKLCHPDRGGRHEDMVVINEDWEILGDPLHRHQYDLARQANSSPSCDLTQEIAVARTKAANYPVQWSDFERWLDDACRDFYAAEWTTTKVLGMDAPLSRRSASAAIFLWVGAAIMVLASVALQVFFVSCRSKKDQINPSNRFAKPHQNKPHWTFLLSQHFLFTIFCGVLGAKGGKWLHGRCSRALALRSKSQ